jgi:hypothetical protein
VSRRRAPRPAAGAFQAALRQVAPQTPLAAIQAAWPRAVGARMAAVAAPVSERDGTLDLMQATLLDRLRDEVGEQAPEGLRFRVNSERF